MNYIKEVFELDVTYMIITIFVLLSAFIAVYEIICKFSEIIGKPIGVMKQRRADHDLLTQTVQDLKELHTKHEEDTKQSIKHDKIIEDKLETLTTLFINKQISDMRWEINNFATKISEGKPCNKDCYQHCFRTYQDYEKILEEHNLKNGEVENSMQIINYSYQQKMKNGEF